MILAVVIMVVLLSFVFGSIAKSISENRGMDGGFAWGFWLWIIGVIVVALRPNDKLLAASRAGTSPSSAAFISTKSKTVFELPGRYYAQGAPIAVYSGALSKDEQTNAVYAGLRLINLCPKAVRAVRVRIFPMDTAGQPLGEAVEYDYLDLDVPRDGEFGKDAPIPMPHASTREFDVSVIRVIFSDKSVWNRDDDAWELMPTPQRITDPELLKQYQLRFGNQAISKPAQIKDIWLCSCGAVNAEKETACHVCGNSRTALLACDFDALNAEKDKRLQEEREKQEVAARRAKRITRRIALGVTAAVFVFIAVVLGTKLIAPSVKYKNAVSLRESGAYEEAIAEFTALGDFRDSADQIGITLDTQYATAETYRTEGSYDLAIDLFERLGDYRDASDQILETKYFFVQSSTDPTDPKTYAYLQELIGKKYKDAQSVFNDLYKWEVSFAVNTDQSDYTTNITSVSRGKRWYVHFTVSGGPPGAGVILSYIYKYPGEGERRDSVSEILYNGDRSFVTFGNTKSARTGAKGMFSFRLYADGVQIGATTVRITD